MTEQEIEEFKRIIDTMIQKASGKGQRQKLWALSVAKQTFLAAIHQRQYGSCSTCDLRNGRRRCEMAPHLGSFVRINCPYYEGSERVEPWRGEGW